jgi:ureidoacrylate peracid hydrolase
MQANLMNALPEDWALLVVDMQNDFLDAGGYYARRATLEERPDWETLSPNEQLGLLDNSDPHHPLGARTEAVDRVVGNIRTAISAARAANRPIAFVRALYDRDFDVVPPLLANAPERQHYPCQPGTWGSEFFGGIADAVEKMSEAKERIVEKHTYDAFSNRSLAAFFGEMPVTAVIVCGTETQICVLSSAQQAALLGYKTFILEDSVWSDDPEIANAALTIFRNAYGKTLTIRDLQENSA